MAEGLTTALALLLTLYGGVAVGAKPPFHLTTIAQGLKHPWGMAFLPDGGILVTERPVRLRLVAQGRLVAEPIAGLPAIAPSGTTFYSGDKFPHWRGNLFVRALAYFHPSRSPNPIDGDHQITFIAIAQ